MDNEPCNFNRGRQKMAADLDTTRSKKKQNGGGGTTCCIPKCDSNTKKILSYHFIKFQLI